jgi:choline kinase
LKSAVILAAGIGSRLSPITDKIPKCCVRVNKKPMIRRIIDQLLSCNSDMKIHVIAGYLSERVREELAGYPQNLKIIENEEYLTTNNMESCRMGLAEHNIISGDVLIINGDCVYSDRIVTLMHDADHSVIGTDSSKYQEENMKVLIRDGRAVAISKDILESQGGVTSIDFYNFISDDIKNLYSIMVAYFQNLDRGKWTEVAINDLLGHPKSEIRTLDVAGEKWMEIDNHDDLKAARNLW